MPNIKSAVKRNSQALIRRQRNRSRKSALRTQIKKVRSAVEQGDRDGANQLLTETLSLIDRTAGSGTIHRNAAARRKSRLTHLVATLGA